MHREEAVSEKGVLYVAFYKHTAYDFLQKAILFSMKYLYVAFYKHTALDFL